ncbi:hydantoinase B/oxoprolinase family protein [Bradyrhizobium sp. KB893862 SZCCT0404]|uniref:hydantoinase B/oxoprolinase family protein n=1 Tax=Bradyrhizobium sp. KB893862 SZCCT0404 TaxID=2807672 RepID=UPI001BA557EF|nr:hydantoinase B/oxoprolinase family protein [Bradyrhizobium sp. KB893862 SZCCT0404]MBR1172744.1 hydantoinase B/oxoprolinase family protein [Bradyrhizobium sp. KB893862 SZCCT0404]
MNKMLPSRAAVSAVDPIELQIIRQRLIAIPNLIEKNIERTAFSLLVQEYKDYAVGFVDACGQLVTQSRYSLPAFVANALGLGVRSGLATFGEEGMRDGDVFFVSDAEVLGGHLNDICMFTPIRIDGALIGFFAVIVHWIDIGGATAGSCLAPTATELAQEGIQYPVMRLVQEGRRLDDIFRLIAKNTRFPQLLMGDVEAQLGGCVMGRELVGEVVEQHGQAGILAAIEAMRVDSRQNMARAIRAVPPGTYTASSFFDDDGIALDQPINVNVKVIADGETLTVDFYDVSDQVPGPFNSGRDGGAVATARMALKFLLSSSTPVNEGEFDNIRVEIPEGKFLSANAEAPHGSGPNTHASVVDTILRAFHEALPDMVPAGHHGIFGTHTITGVDERTGQRFLCMDAMSGGWGAFSNSDGPGPFRSTAHGDVRDVPVEIQEALYPYRIETKRLREDSGGAGRFRGGLGIEKVYRFLQPLTLMNKLDRTKCPPWGLAGGAPGEPAGGEVIRASGERHPLRKGVLAVGRDDRLVISSGGGGGHGPASEREADRLNADVLEGYVTVAGALRDYGVALKTGADQGQES